MDEFNHYVPPTTKISFQSNNKTFHVFLSFRGKDVRYTFVDHLYEALSAAGLRVFLDTSELKKGENIDESLKAAIASSAICIPIFSRDYASSAWCLREATCMLNCSGLIIPLFYDVEPTQVRFPESDKSPYAKSFAKHSEKGRYQKEDIELWKQSLQQICARSGWSKELTGGYEGQLVKRVTWDVINSLDKVPLDVAAYPVGLEDMKQALIQNLYLSFANDVIKLGILGIGGIGKTTLAKAVYNEVQRCFDGSSFVFNVRSTAEKASGLMELQGRILKDLVKYGGEVRSVDEGKALMRDLLGGVRALVILDDVDSTEQLQALLGGWMAPGSRVLVTSRDSHILNLAQISTQFIYEMSGLKENKALQLFSWHAFLRSSPNQQYEDISRRIVKACQGHPLSLEVVGAFLYDKKNEKDIECWNETLVNIGGREEIFKTLHISYNALSLDEKQIFLDTACFFKGEKKTDPIVFWKSLDYKRVNSAISNLSMKLLLKIDDQGVFDMHDHLQDMGREIVKRGISGERNRVWETEDACNLFNNDLTKQYMNVSHLSLQGGYLQCTKVWNTPMLRLLHMKDTKIKHSTVKLNPNLIWLRLNLFPSALASEQDGLYKWNPLFSPNGRPRFSFSFCGHDWQLRSASEEDGLYKWNPLFSPKGRPRFSFGGHDWQLRIMDLSGCTDLLRLPSSIGNLSKLQSLTLHGCEKLKNLPDSMDKLSQLHSLDVSGCYKLKDLPRNIGHLRKLQSLNVSRCLRLKGLPLTFGNLSQLYSLDLSGCSGLKNLPDALGNLSQLYSLDLPVCSGLKNLPDALGNLSQLHSLDLSGCYGLKNLPDAIGNLSQLYSLDLSGCSGLENLPDAIGNLSQLHSLNLSSCSGLKNLPDALGNLSQLHSLHLFYCFSLENLQYALGNLSQLHSLHNLRDSLHNLRDALGNLSRLRSLNLCGCSGLTNLPDALGNLSQLHFLYLCCSGLTNLPDALGNLSQLHSLYLSGCSGLTNLPDALGNLSQLHSLYLSDCSGLTNLPDAFGNLSQLHSLDLSGCSRLKNLRILSVTCHSCII